MPLKRNVEGCVSCLLQIFASRWLFNGRQAGVKSFRLLTFILLMLSIHYLAGEYVQPAGAPLFPLCSKALEGQGPKYFPLLILLFDLEPGMLN